MHHQLMPCTLDVGPTEVNNNNGLCAILLNRLLNRRGICPGLSLTCHNSQRLEQEL